MVVGSLEAMFVESRKACVCFMHVHALFGMLQGDEPLNLINLCTLEGLLLWAKSTNIDIVRSLLLAFSSVGYEDFLPPAPASNPLVLL